jgi:hypothetical protein
MENYFSSQDGYFGQYDDVNDFLTNLEKENEKMIQQIENE